MDKRYGARETLARLCARYGVTCEAEPAGTTTETTTAPAQPSYTVTLHMGDAAMTSLFHAGEWPTVDLVVLAWLQDAHSIADAEGDFYEWAGALGYDPDDLPEDEDELREVEATGTRGLYEGLIASDAYAAVTAQTEALEALLGAHYELFSAAAGKGSGAF